MLLLILNACVLLPLSAGAQSPLGSHPSPPPPQADAGSRYVIRQDVDEVLLYCTVLNRSGKPVTGLSQSAFRVFESGQASQIVHFTGEDLPVSLDLVLDDSDSMRPKRSVVQAAALDLIRMSNPNDETALTNFADEDYLDQDFTADVRTLQRALQDSKSVSGGTALFDTVIKAADHLAKAAHHSKQVIVIVTDGRDNASNSDLAAAVRRVQAANGPVIYTIGLLFDLPALEAHRARHDLQALSDETGGIAFFPTSVGEVDQVASDLARNIRNQYFIAYRPPTKEGDQPYRTVRVEAAVAGEGKLTVRTRKGYLRADGTSERE